MSSCVLDPTMAFKHWKHLLMDWQHSHIQHQQRLRYRLYWTSSGSHIDQKWRHRLRARHRVRANAARFN
jgi:hypothetical protein